MKEKLSLYTSRRITIFFFAMIVMLLFITTANCADSKKNNSCLTFKKDLFYVSKKLSAITNIVYHKSKEGGQVFIFGQKRLQVVDFKTKKLIDDIQLDWPTGLLRPDLIFSGDHYKIASRGPVSKLGIMNNKGKIEWMFNPGPSVLTNTMCYGDLNNDKENEYYVSTNDGVFQLNKDGKVIWKRERPSRDVELLQLGKETLIASVGTDRAIDCYDYSGFLKKSIKTNIELYDIELINWQDTSYIVTYSGSNIIILDNNGEKIVSRDLQSNIYMLRATMVYLDGTKEPYLTILARLSSTIGKSIFCFISREGDILYKELINVSQGIAIIGDNSLGGKVILVGDGIGTIYKYSLINSIRVKEGKR